MANDTYEIRTSLEIEDSWAMPVEIAPAIIQTIAATAPKIFFLTRRCFKGRNVACVRSKEIAPRIINNAMGETSNKANTRIINSSLSARMVVQSSHWYAQIGKKIENTGPS